MVCVDRTFDFTHHWCVVGQMRGEHDQILHRLVPVFGDVFAHDVLVSSPFSHCGTRRRHDGYSTRLRRDVSRVFIRRQTSHIPQHSVCSL